jgi:iron(III) transport system ATP-binding protein
VPTAITTVELTKTFPGAAAPAVDHVSLEIGRGELFFLLGPSGCGKTTLLRMIAGFIEPTSGAVKFDGRDITDWPPNRRNTGMVFQSYALWPHMTVEQNVAFGLGLRKVARAEQARRIGEALGAVHMSDYAARKPNQLSGGQQQRVALARALVIRPDVLLLDEPLSNLDAKLRIELRSEIRRICKEAGITTVYVTHDQKEALSMADRMAVLKEGRVAAVGTPGGLYRRPPSAFVAEFLGETNFIQATSMGGSGLSTPAGSLRTNGAPGAAAGTGVVVSIRPEAFRLGIGREGSSTLRGRILESTYLGELAQYVVELPGPTKVKAAAINPGAPLSPGSEIALSVEPDDVVVLPAE